MDFGYLSNHNSYSRYQLSNNLTLPGFTFGLYVQLNDPAGPILGKEVSVGLYPWDGVTPIEADATGRVHMNTASITTCVAVTNGAAFPWCNFILPSTGFFVILASLPDANNRVLTTALPGKAHNQNLSFTVGKTAAEWKMPLFTLPSTEF